MNVKKLKNSLDMIANFFYKEIGDCASLNLNLSVFEDYSDFESFLKKAFWKTEGKDLSCYFTQGTYGICKDYGDKRFSPKKAYGAYQREMENFPNSKDVQMFCFDVSKEQADYLTEEIEDRFGEDCPNGVVSTTIFLLNRNGWDHSIFNLFFDCYTKINPLRGDKEREKEFLYLNKKFRTEIKKYGVVAGSTPVVVKDHFLFVTPKEAFEKI